MIPDAPKEENIAARTTLFRDKKLFLLFAQRLWFLGINLRKIELVFCKLDCNPDCILVSQSAPIG